MSIPETVKNLWNEWDIRFFVISSLALQVLLIFFAPIRKRKLSRWLSPLIWSFYLLADWVATFSLGLLSDSQSDDNNCSSIISMIRRASLNSNRSSNTNKELQAFWAPFLLLHLGGPDTITAFALEDNELWLRHLLGLLFEVAMAGYVFSRAFPMKRLLVPTILMFLSGTIKYGERTRALYLASMDGFRDSMLGKPDPGPNYAKLMNEYTSKKEAGVPSHIDIKKEEQDSTALTIAEEEISARPPPVLTEIDVVQTAHRFFLTFRGLIANLIFSFRDRDESRSFFKKLKAQDAFRVIETELNFIYEVLYTKGAVVHTTAAYVLRGVCSCSILAALVLFALTKKPNYDKVDIGITYALLGGAAILDVVALIMLILSDKMIISMFVKFPQLGEKGENGTQYKSVLSRILETIQSIKNPRWSESVSQYNLIDFCLSRRPKCINKMVSMFGVRDLLDQFQYTSCKTIDRNLKEFIFSELTKKSRSANDSKSIRMLCSCRGNWVLEERGYQSLLGWSVEAEFDESLLLWHIATDIRYSKAKEDDANSAENALDKGADIPDYREMSKNISDYMLYLLVVQPAMMSSMAGIGLIRYRDTCAEAKIFFPIQKPKNKAEALQRLSKARRMLLEVNTEVHPIYVKGDRSKSVLFDAVRLAKQLEELPSTRKWRIICEVWVDLLSYAASHCRGSAHAARLSKGGELLMFVWFLMAHLGLGEQFCIEAGHARAKLIVEK